MSADVAQLFLNDDQRSDIKHGLDLLKRLFSLFQVANYHTANNIALVQPSKDAAESIHWFIGRESVRATFVCGQHGAFAGAHRVRVHRRDLELVEDFYRFLTTRGIGGFSFLEPMTPEQLRQFAVAVVQFVPEPHEENGVFGLTKVLESMRLDTFIEPVEPMQVDARGSWGGFDAKTELGALIAAFAKGYALLSMMHENDTPALEHALKQWLKDVIGIEGDMLAKMIGVVSLANAQDMAMRSLTSLLVCIAIANRFGAAREVMLELGHICVEQARWDLGVIKQSKQYGLPMAGATALGGINRHRTWSVDLMQRFVTVAARYCPPESVGSQPGVPVATRVSEILRMATDYVDMIVPTPLRGTDRLLQDVPIAPHAALFRLYDYVEARYTDDIHAALVHGVGLLTLGTAVECADGSGCVLYERTADPVTWVAKDAITEEIKEVGFIRGPGEIVNVVTGADLLEVRSRLLIGEDFHALQKTAEEVKELAKEWS